MYVIVGANGFLGSYLRMAVKEMTEERILALATRTDSVEEDDRTEWLACDVTKAGDVEKVKNRLGQEEEGHKILYLAAYHNPDLVEKNPRHAWNVNITALSNFINTIENVKCFFYPSTDSVYGDGGDTCHFSEWDRLSPVNRYGHHKVAAECLVYSYGYNVVRLPFLIGPSLLSHKKHFYDQIAETIGQGKEMKMFADSKRSSLDFGTAAKLIVRLAENYREDMPEIINVSGDEDLSKYDVGRMIAKKIGADESLIVPITSEQTEGIFEARRAKSTLMDNSLLKQYLGLDQVRIMI